MSDTSSSNPSPAETGAPDGEEHELTQRQEQSPVKSTDAKLPQDWKAGLSMRNRLEARKGDFTEEDRGKAWNVVDEAVKTYSDEMVQRWIAEMDTLLVYAGLFSAVLTAFNVESYSLLSPTAPDPVLAALTQISAQLTSFSVHDPFVNSTYPAFQLSSVPSNSAAPDRWAVWLNALWFSSLLCSLSAAFVAIMVKQWINEYNSGLFGTSRHTVRFRQHRYNGLVKWKVAAIIAVLPVLLQIASGLFLAGLLILLWNLNRTVAIVSSALVGTLLAFTLVTIILPSCTSNCAYLSPLSISLFRLCRLICAPIVRVIYKPIRTFIAEKALSVYRNAPSGSILERISDKLSSPFDDSFSPSVYAMQSAYVTYHPLQLDQDVFITAYSATGDLSLLEHTSTCLSDHYIEDLSQFFTRIHAQNKDFGDTAGGHWTNSIPLDMASDMLLVEACDTPRSDASGKTSNQHISSVKEMAHSGLICGHVVLDDRRISCVLSNMAAVLYNDGDPHRDGFAMGRCLKALRSQIKSVKDTQSTLTDDVRRRVIEAIYTVVRTSIHNEQWRDAGEICLDILLLCSFPTISRSQHGEMAEKPTRRKPFADAIALAEDALTTTLQYPEFQDGGRTHKCLTVDFFLRYYQRIGLEQLAGRVSEKMLMDLAVAVQDLQVGGHTPWWDKDYNTAWKDGMLEWLLSLDEEREKQAAEKHESAGTSI